jgi:hypothetical protein
MADGQEVDDPEAAEARTSVTTGSTRVAADGYQYTPLYRAQNEDRYLRQTLIRQYQDDYSCHLVVMIDQIMPESVTLMAELLHGLNDSKDLHLMLCSPGGDGETAVRLARMAQASCRKFVVIVPESAKSAATILTLGAHEIVMGPTSDLGPIDPQVLVPDRGFVSAKDLLAGVEKALHDVSDQPDTYPLHAAMLAGIDSTVVQFARSALARTGDLAKQAVSSNPDRSPRDVSLLCRKIARPLIEAPHSHGAVIGAVEAATAGLPVVDLQPTDRQWQEIWALWTRYFALGPVPLMQVYEGARASQVRIYRPPSQGGVTTRSDVRPIAHYPAYRSPSS